MRTSRLLLYIAISFVSFYSNAQQEPGKPNADRVMVNTAKNANIKCITPPLGFDTLTGLNGYFHRKIGSSIVVSTVNGKTVKDAEAAFNDTHIANIKSELLSKTWYTLEDGKEMLVYHLTYDHKGEKWGRFQAFVGDSNSTLWFVISYPYVYAQDVEGVLLKSLRTVKFDQR